MLASPHPLPGDAGPWTRRRSRLRAALPLGRSLADDTWAWRHGIVTTVLWTHVALLAVVGALGDGAAGAALALPVLAAAVVAQRPALGRVRELVAV
jgi:hypothetical protein